MSKFIPKYISYCGAALLLSISGCIDSYSPSVPENQSNFLVVDGGINSQGVTTIRLSRTMSLASKKQAPVESKARMFIEQADGQRYPLTESASGTYTSASLLLPAEKLVRLRFTTASGREYASDYTAAKYTPPIDSVSWRVRPDGVQVYVNTHDDVHLARYYRWSFDETWEFTSIARSTLEYKDDSLVYRNENIYNCWGSEAPSTILLGNTLKLSRDVIFEQPVRLLPQNSTKLRYKYSTLVKQYALTVEEYNYWEALRKNTETLGTLTDPMPTQLTGNVHNVLNAEEIVIGFVGAQSVQQQRLFVSRAQLPDEWKFLTGYEGCEVFVLPIPFSNPVSHTKAELMDVFKRGDAIPILEILDPPPGYASWSYFVAIPECADCRKRGTNVRPPFWR
ncbi:DUF4249 domain-containing protein [Hymenobacter pini]|uniref:DUF4249 domain-containing protein n=1 Tax=Hymenobacter pini TaxID=2880879 RepID=UPI001CF1B4DB|nr:DUF4249 domain-containing protein [Hymenobacter pini]MCA8831454.1 DUF4249 domain-containing protein [Hymenobacter pini]